MSHSPNLNISIAPASPNTNATTSSSHDGTSLSLPLITITAPTPKNGDAVGNSDVDMNMDAGIADGNEQRDGVILHVQEDSHSYDNAATDASHENQHPNAHVQHHEAAESQHDAIQDTMGAELTDILSGRSTMETIMQQTQNDMNAHADAYHAAAVTENGVFGMEVLRNSAQQIIQPTQTTTTSTRPKTFFGTTFDDSLFSMTEHPRQLPTYAPPPNPPYTEFDVPGLTVPYVILPETPPAYINPVDPSADLKSYSQLLSYDEKLLTTLIEQVEHEMLKGVMEECAFKRLRRELMTQRNQGVNIHNSIRQTVEHMKTVMMQVNEQSNTKKGGKKTKKLAAPKKGKTTTKKGSTGVAIDSSMHYLRQVIAQEDTLVNNVAERESARETARRSTGARRRTSSASTDGAQAESTPTTTSRKRKRSSTTKSSEESTQKRKKSRRTREETPEPKMEDIVESAAPTTIRRSGRLRQKTRITYNDSSDEMPSPPRVDMMDDPEPEIQSRKRTTRRKSTESGTSARPKRKTTTKKTSTKKSSNAKSTTRRSQSSTSEPSAEEERSLLEQLEQGGDEIERLLNEE